MPAAPAIAQIDDYDAFALEAEGRGEAGVDSVQRETSSSIHLYFVITSEVAEPLFYLDGDKGFPISAGFRAVTPAVFLNNGRTVTIARQGRNAAGEVIYTPLSSLELDSGVRAAIVAIIPNRTADGISYGLRAFDHGLRAQPLNSARFINLSPRELVVQMDEENFRIGPYGDAVKRIPPERTHLTMFAGIVIRQEGRVLDRSRQQFREGTRVVFIGFPDVRREYGTAFTVVRHRDQGP